MSVPDPTANSAYGLREHLAYPRRGGRYLEGEGARSHRWRRPIGAGERRDRPAGPSASRSVVQLIEAIAPTFALKGLDEVTPPRQRGDHRILERTRMSSACGHAYFRQDGAELGPRVRDPHPSAAMSCSTLPQGVPSRAGSLRVQAKEFGQIPLEERARPGRQQGSLLEDVHRPRAQRRAAPRSKI